MPRGKPRERKQRGNQDANKKFYGTAIWRKKSKRIRMRDTIANDGIGCCICAASDGTGNADHCDHIIAISDGGAPHDERNLWGICVFHHNVKSGYETKGITIPSRKGHDGLIPIDRNYVIELILKGRKDVQSE